MKVLALMKYGSRAASPRQRMLQYIPDLAKAGVEVDVSVLFGDDYLKALARRVAPSRAAVALAYAKRVAQMLAWRRYDLVFLQYEIFPYLPGFFESLGARACRRLIVDYDDAIFHQYDLHAMNVVRRLLGRKLQPLMSRADLCICGNRYLQEYASRFCDQTIVIPTVVDAERYGAGALASRARPVVGWMGSPSTYQQLAPTLRVLKETRDALGVDFRVVGSGLSEEPDSGVTFIDWSEEREVDDLACMDIGVMPLPDDPWARGKCGYKLIQYMASGLPVVASPVGVNAEIVEHGVNGLLAQSDAEWVEAVATLARDPDLRRRMGAAGRAKAVACYSLQAQAPRFVGAVTEVLNS